MNIFTEYPDNTKPINKTLSKSAMKVMTKNGVLVGISALTLSGKTITGKIFLQKNIRPSDFLTDPTTKRIVVTDPLVDGHPIGEVLILVLVNCEYIAPKDAHVDIADR